MNGPINRNIAESSGMGAEHPNGMGTGNTKPGHVPTYAEQTAPFSGVGFNVPALQAAFGKMDLYKLGINPNDNPQQILAQLKTQNPAAYASIVGSQGNASDQQLLNNIGYAFGEWKRGYAIGAPMHAAEQFRKEAPQLQQNLGDAASKQMQQKLAQALSSVRQNASNRGLLYSGLEKGAEGGTRVQAGSQLAQQKAQINQGIQDTSNQLAGKATQGYLDEYGRQLGGAQSAYENALGQYKQHMANSSLMGQGLGYGIGGMMGSGKQSPGGAPTGSGTNSSGGAGGYAGSPYESTNPSQSYVLPA